MEGKVGFINQKSGTQPTVTPEQLNTYLQAQKTAQYQAERRYMINAFALTILAGRKWWQWKTPQKIVDEALMLTAMIDASTTTEE